jgi:hypothetical protein
MISDVSSVLAGSTAFRPVARKNTMVKKNCLLHGDWTAKREEMTEDKIYPSRA